MDTFSKANRFEGEQNPELRRNHEAPILVVDDERSIVEILGEFLGEAGYAYAATISPVEALDRLKQEKFSLLLTDLKMPRIDGIEMVRAAKQLDPDMAIIVISALVDTQRAVEALRVGADDYVIKPFDLGEISLCIERALEKRWLILENRRYQAELEHRVRAATADLEQANRQLRETKEYLESLLHSTADAIITTDGKGVISFVNEGAMRMLDRTRDELVGMFIGDIFVNGAEEALAIHGLLEENMPLENHETELRRRTGQPVPVNMSISFVNDGAGSVVSMLAICRDITRQKELEAVLKELSVKDSLTGLYNQRYFYERLDTEIERARRQKHPLSLLLFDVDRFKQYNDRFGHLAGDNVLQAAGEVVAECTREHVDVGCRYGGDEFTVILPEADESQAYNVGTRILASFQARKFEDLSLSIGLTMYRNEFPRRRFIQFTDAMMYEAKRAGGGRISVYRPEMNLPVEG